MQMSRSGHSADPGFVYFILPKKCFYNVKRKGFIYDVIIDFSIFLNMP